MKFTQRDKRQVWNLSYTLMRLGLLSFESRLKFVIVASKYTHWRDW